MRGAYIESEQSAEYTRLAERRAELNRLTLQARRRKPLLLFGPEGVGKTRLLQEFAQAEPLALYVSGTRSPHGMLLSLAVSLRKILGLRSIPSHASTMSTTSLKGVVNRALDAKAFMLIVDHVEGPSRVVTRFIKDLGYYGRTPIFLAARSPHMEDIGGLQPLCAGRSERLELLNWPLHVALAFARHQSDRAGLRAANLDVALSSLVQSSRGNPGSIVRLLEMARQPQYWVDDHIKFHALYLDYRMGRRS